MIGEGKYTGLYEDKLCQTSPVGHLEDSKFTLVSKSVEGKNMIFTVGKRFNKAELFNSLIKGIGRVFEKRHKGKRNYNSKSAGTHGYD